MKKILTTIVTVMTVVAFGIANVFAAGSTSDVVEITDANVDYTASETSVPWITSEVASSITSDSSSELRVLWQVDLSSETLPATFTFNANGTDGQTLYVFHWNGSAWELIATGTGPSVTATFNSLSPVALVTKVPASASNNEATTSDSSDSATTSPATGNTASLIAALSVLVVAGSAAYVVATKKV